MRTLGSALVLFIALWVEAQPPAPANSAFSGNLSIPAQLSHTVRADKAHAGDPVEFETLQAVLVGKGLVMPAGARLRGRVLLAGAKQEQRNSYLALVVERAEWKEHSLPLHAFIAAQLTLTPRSSAVTDPQNEMEAPTPTPRRAQRPNARGAAMADPTLGNMVRTPHDATTTTQPPPSMKYPKLDNVGFFRAKDGTVYLLSSKSNVKLPAGVLFLLQNQPVGDAASTPGGGVSSAKP